MNNILVLGLYAAVKADRCECLSPELITACCMDDSLCGCNCRLEFPRFLSTFQRTTTSLIILSSFFFVVVLPERLCVCVFFFLIELASSSTLFM